MSALRREVVQVYRHCLQSAARCPEQTHRATMRAYVQMKFRDKAHVRDAKAIALLLADAKEELERMNYYHSMYQSGQTQKATHGETAQLASHCPNCNHAFATPTARFCSECGVQRPTIA
ncbi:hypothetical protein SDRG_05420 [Saprolegnia diclina VS20]|uniref:Complex 1 LYR protein domain-containing protein n=1 Tax=Saprolegnia diclina (strain VS20) TaxID=1156394 RepID=T0QGU6_SAPDV|nr:hypothetical protein SDRG_05420 [Saprolegnia diclina VS20]EQC37194.1 hypothetical protein SDRG_05420 [Saprolegnia diclina VS20]|eukprot:XP_008609356.1 hypothetical protein SDRG_05420 [Saprolegnia diclina VS20]